MTGRAARLAPPVLFVLLAVFLTSPRLLTGALHVADDWHDNEIFYWNFWWLGEALLRGADPFFSSAVFYPEGTSLGFHPTAWLYAIFSLPFQLLLGPSRGVVYAHNLIVILSLSLAALFATRLARQSGVEPLPAAAGGLMFGFSAYHFWHLGRLHVGGVEWLALFALAVQMLLEAQDRPLRRGLMTGGAAVLLLYSSLTNLLSGLLLAALLLLPVLLRAGDAGGVGATLKRLAPPVGLAAAILLVAALPFLHAWWSYPGPVRTQAGEAANVEYSADLAGFVAPGPGHRIYGAVARAVPGVAATGGRETFVGFLPLMMAPLALLAAGTRRRALPWAGAGAVFFLLSLGPVLKAGGVITGLPLPYRLLHAALPVLRINRTPVRFVAPLLLCLAVLTALGVSAWLARSRRPALAAGLVGVLALADAAHRPPRLEPTMAPPRVYAQVAASPAAHVVLHVPLYHALLERRLMFHQVHHGHTVTTACIPRASAAQHGLIEGTALRACLLTPAACDRVEPAFMAEELRRREIGWVILHRELLPEEHLATLVRILSLAGGARTDDPAGLTAFRFAPAPPPS